MILFAILAYLFRPFLTGLQILKSINSTSSLRRSKNEHVKSIRVKKKNKKQNKTKQNKKQNKKTTTTTSKRKQG